MKIDGNELKQKKSNRNGWKQVKTSRNEWKRIETGVNERETNEIEGCFNEHQIQLCKTVTFMLKKSVRCIQDAR